VLPGIEGKKDGVTEGGIRAIKKQKTLHPDFRGGFKTIHPQFKIANQKRIRALSAQRQESWDMNSRGESEKGMAEKTGG